MDLPGEQARKADAQLRADEALARQLQFDEDSLLGPSRFLKNDSEEESLLGISGSLDDDSEEDKLSGPSASLKDDRQPSAASTRSPTQHSKIPPAKHNIEELEDAGLTMIETSWKEFEKSLHAPSGANAIRRVARLQRFSLDKCIEILSAYNVKDRTTREERLLEALQALAGAAFLDLQLQDSRRLTGIGRKIAEDKRVRINTELSQFYVELEKRRENQKDIEDSAKGAPTQDTSLSSREWIVSEAYIPDDMVVRLNKLLERKGVPGLEKRLTIRKAAKLFTKLKKILQPQWYELEWILEKGKVKLKVQASTTDNLDDDVVPVCCAMGCSDKCPPRRISRPKLRTRHSKEAHYSCQTPNTPSAGKWKMGPIIPATATLRGQKEVLVRQ